MLPTTARSSSPRSDGGGSRPGKGGLAAEKRDSDTRVRFFRLRLGSSGRVTQLTALSLPEKPRAAQLGGIALSPDGSKLAIDLLAGSGPANAQRTRKSWVINLATGSSEQWVWPGTGWVGNFKPMGEPLSWTADGRMLAFQKWTGSNVAVRLLDTTAPGADLRSAGSS